MRTMPIESTHIKINKLISTQSVELILKRHTGYMYKCTHKQIIIQLSNDAMQE